MTMIPARVPYTPPELGGQYNRSEIRTALGNLARSVPPQVTRVVTGDTTALVTDDLIVCDTTDDALTVTLPPVGQVQFLRVTVINVGANTVTVSGTVSGVTNPTLTQWQSITVQSDGVRWMKIASV